LLCRGNGPSICTRSFVAHSGRRSGRLRTILCAKSQAASNPIGQPWAHWSPCFQPSRRCLSMLRTQHCGSLSTSPTRGTKYKLSSLWLSSQTSCLHEASIRTVSPEHRVILIAAIARNEHVEKRDA